MFVTRNLAEGPTGLFDSHMNKSFCLRCSKNMQLLHDFSKHISSTTSPTSFLFTFDSILVLGIKSWRSFTRWRIRPAIPLEQITRVLWRFFHSLDAGSGSLNALKSFSGSKSIISLPVLTTSLAESLFYTSSTPSLLETSSTFSSESLESTSSSTGLTISAFSEIFYLFYNFLRTDAIFVCLISIFVINQLLSS